MPHLSLHERDDGVVPGLAILSNHTVSFDHKVFRISITFLISWSFWHVYESCVMHDALRRLCCKLRSILFWRFCVAGDVARKKIATCAMRNISRFRSLELNNSQTVLGCFGLKGRCRQAKTGSGWIRQMSKILLETSSVEGLGLAEKSLSEARQGHEAMGWGVGSLGGDWRQTKHQK
jgi:hypothetical protein